MIFKIKTSKKTMDIFLEIGNSINLPPYILAKLSISASLREKNKLCENDFNTDNAGLELNRYTITGEYDLLYKLLIEEYENKIISETDYMTKYLKSHLDRGARLIYSEFKYGGDFLLNLLEQKSL